MPAKGIQETQKAWEMLSDLQPFMTSSRSKF